ncbi:MAG: hypothetical protein ACYC7E_22805 [Armatimonadota bacterium]
MRYLPLLLVSALFCFTGCRTTPPAADTSTTSGGTTTSSPSTVSALAVTDSAGKSILVFEQPKEPGGYLVKGAAGLIGQIGVTSGKVNIFDATGTKVGAVKKDGEDFILDDAAGKKIFKFSAKEGGYRLKDAAGNMLLKLKPKDYGYKISDGAGVAIAKLKQKDAKLDISTEDGTKLYKITGIKMTPAAGLLMSKKLTPLQQAALITAAIEL